MFRLTTVPIDPTTLRNAADNPHAGAVSIFEGLVRNHHEGRRVLRLEYEAHRAVAEKEGRRILEEAT
ncbi:MAG TPA: molybdopterin-converting factor chain 2, partial [Verrucomicrobiales bacterium]|nr:molybdopterin-converting factor chain 2 [Verrucomicrobiales bacterium]